MNANVLTPGQLRHAVAGSSFYLGMRVLPQAQREAMYAIYGFCRIVDDIADDMGADRGLRAARLGLWRGWIGALYRGGDLGEAAFLARAVAQFGLEEADFLAVIEGMAMDVAGDLRWPDFAVLDLYCDRVASAVGRLSVNVFGMEREVGVGLAHHLGRALQFTNILRDLDEDAAMGRVYLPREALAAAGIEPQHVAEVMGDARLDRAARWLGVRAQEHFLAAGAILAGRPKGCLIAPRLMLEAYVGLLGQRMVQGWAAPRVRVRRAKWRLAWRLLVLLVRR
jgi:squalene synthase HpnD